MLESKRPVNSAMLRRTSNSPEPPTIAERAAANALHLSSVMQSMMYELAPSGTPKQRPARDAASAPVKTATRQSNRKSAEPTTRTMLRYLSSGIVKKDC